MSEDEKPKSETFREFCEREAEESEPEDEKQSETFAEFAERQAEEEQATEESEAKEEEIKIRKKRLELLELMESKLKEDDNPVTEFLSENPEYSEPLEALLVAFSVIMHTPARKFTLVYVSKPKEDGKWTLERQFKFYDSDDKEFFPEQFTDLAKAKKGRR